MLEPDLQAAISGAIPDGLLAGGFFYGYDKWQDDLIRNQQAIDAFYYYWRRVLIPEYTSILGDETQVYQKSISVFRDELSPL